ncbi:hypothetical protein RchiOBHm_Chr2g0160281 [Rosa chinensis]|uniref:Uncharacterized protein n=1 Tax=Rosa chinensis TaxID=74649 RepID=A0A2P6S2I1_ROSCH|nr:hypothetical protein RchiOBHm_Chr2g0160281 [Rosa chinensis]
MMKLSFRSQSTWSCACHGDLTVAYLPSCLWSLSRCFKPLEVACVYMLMGVILLETSGSLVGKAKRKQWIQNGQTKATPHCFLAMLIMIIVFFQV